MKMKKYPPITIEELLAILGTTIKHDDDNKLVTLLVKLLAYTEDSQLNLSFNAPSSSGKSFIPMEIAKLFPVEDIKELGYVSPTAFFHSAGEYDKENKQYLVNLERKILIFLDQPHTQLLEHLRPLLSHDKKEIEVQITDKSQKHGLRTKKVILRGYPVVIFCSAGLRMDEQEATRFLLLSPEINQDKLEAGIREALKRSADTDAYWDYTELNVPRCQLKGRIEAIKEEHIENINIGEKDVAYIENRFFKSFPIHKPRHQRDIKRVAALAKSLALLNLWHRKRFASSVIVDRSDIEEAFAIWDRISVTQELNIPPYVYDLYKNIILAEFNNKNGNRTDGFEDITGTIGVTRQEILNRHYKVYGRHLDALNLRQQIIPALTQAGLIYEEPNPTDKRSKLIYPQQLINNSELGGGVNPNEAENQDVISDIKELWPDAKELI